MGSPLDVLADGDGRNEDLSTWMSMVVEALTYSGMLLLLIVLGRMGTSGDGHVG